MHWAICYNDPIAEAKNAAAQLVNQQFKVIFFWNPENNLLDGITQESIVKEIPSSEKYTAWFETFYTTLKQQKIAPDLLVCDYEGWIADWNWGAPIQDVMTAGKNINTAYLRASYYPYLYVYKKNTDYLGFGSFNATHGPNQDRNGWTYPQGIDYSYTGASSPAVYLDQGGNYFNLQNNFTHDVAWNCFIQNLNNLRGCQGSFTAPWVSYTSFGDDGNPWRKIPNAMAWLWNEQLKHLNAMGIQYILYWNPAECINANEVANKLNTTFQNDCISALPPTPEKPKNLPLLQMDLDAITTGNITTKYVDFVAMLRKDGSNVYDKTNHVADIQPYNGSKVSGKVTTADGKPFGGAKVGLQTAAVPIVWISANADGNYDFEKVKDGYYTVVLPKKDNQIVKADQYYQIKVQSKDIVQDIVVK